MQPSADPHFQPITASERINSLDVIRGIALLGILLLNIVGFGLAFSYADPSVAGVMSYLWGSGSDFSESFSDLNYTM